MSSDDRFREMFYEEARELLISLEEGLMDLERRQSDRAHLDRTFRAAHTLKGAAGIVGLGAVAEFTDGIEAVLDRIRSGSLAVDSDIITTLLEARDHLAMMVEAEAVKSPIPPSGELTQRLAALLRGPGSSSPGGGQARAPAQPGPVPRPAQGEPGPAAPIPGTAGNGPQTPGSEAAALSSSHGGPPEARPPSTQAEESRPPGGESPGEAAPAAKAKRKRPPRKPKKMAAAPESDLPSQSSLVPAPDGLTVYQITLIPGPDVLRRGANPLGVLDELRELGETTITTDPGAVPPLEQLDPEALLPDVDDPGENRGVARSSGGGIPVFRGRQRHQHQPASSRWQAGAGSVGH